jgi:hypothetical protein
MKKLLLVLLIIIIATTLSIGCTEKDKNKTTEKGTTAAIEYTLKYNNAQFGFDFLLPDSWKGFKIDNSKWEGRLLDEKDKDKQLVSGAMVTISHPKSKKDSPRQDIPIMVIPLETWELIIQEKLAIGAAPVPPEEIGRNKIFIFALPARYNFENLPGTDEVNEIMKNKPLKPLE